MIDCRKALRKSGELFKIGRTNRFDACTGYFSKKTFMTNFLAKGGSLLTAMAITGNKDLKATRRYYKIVDTPKADEMARVFGK